MIGRKQLILMTGVGLTVVTTAVLLSTMGDSEGQLLITRLVENAGLPDDQPEKPKKNPPGPAHPPGVKAIDRLPSEASEEDHLRVLFERGLPAGLAEPFIGTWTERSVTEDSIATVKATLHRDGSFEMSAVVKPRDATSRSMRLNVSGHWTMDERDVVIVIDESDDTDSLAAGFIQIFADSRVTGPDWTYTDAEGVSRVMRKR